MAGSESFPALPQSERPDRDRSGCRPIHLAMTYEGDGTIRSLSKMACPSRRVVQVVAFRSNSPPCLAQVTIRSSSHARRYQPVARRHLGTRPVVRSRLEPVRDRRFASEHSATTSPLSEIIAGRCRPDDRNKRAASSRARSSGCDRRRAGRPSVLRPSHPANSDPMRMEIRGNPNQPGDVVGRGWSLGSLCPRRPVRSGRPTLPEWGQAASARSWGRGCAAPAIPVRPRRGQSSLASTFRDGSRRELQRSRLQRRPAVASGTARLAGLGDRHSRLEPEGDASSDRRFGRLQAVVAI